jgi:hypothetical protein
MIKSILFSELVSIMVVVIAILIVISTIQLQPLQNRQALAQNITLANKSGNLTGLRIALNTVGKRFGFWPLGANNYRKTYSHQFTKAGDFPYFCELHTAMIGKVTAL